jgi:hypothetical protein
LVSIVTFGEQNSVMNLPASGEEALETIWNGVQELTGKVAVWAATECARALGRQIGEGKQ